MSTEDGTRELILSINNGKAKFKFDGGYDSPDMLGSEGELRVIVEYGLRHIKEVSGTGEPRQFVKGTLALHELIGVWLDAAAEKIFREGERLQ